jgi:hypothetical protein
MDFSFLFIPLIVLGLAHIGFTIVVLYVGYRLLKRCIRTAIIEARKS